MAVNDELGRFLKTEFARQTNTIKEELEKLREEIKQVGVDTDERLKNCEVRLSRVEREILEIKRRSLRNNIIISGLEANCSSLVNYVISKLNALLSINLLETEVNNIYRLGKTKPVIKIEFVSFLAKSKVIENRHKLKGSRVYINEDLCEEDRNDLKILRQQMNVARANGQRAYIWRRFLIVDGEKFSVEQLKDQTELGLQAHLGEGPSNIPTDLVSSAPNSPAPITRFTQMLTEHEHLTLEEGSKISKEISTINQVLERTKDWEIKSRTRSQSSGSGSAKKEQKLVTAETKQSSGSGSAKKEQKTSNSGRKGKKGG
ncbi:uncharacterized protein LOC123322646 [Coccinella septempunctata]|uniref:uncharacterized protein LOC123322646 n=1 Tax=Coccinella septempunctata TaxID=41139 RepID=UPI001D093F48|nr:uncharacterized protein LOC123322646 [Coccinella septempunctata]